MWEPGRGVISRAMQNPIRHFVAAAVAAFLALPAAAALQPAAERDVTALLDAYELVSSSLAADRLTSAKAEAAMLLSAAENATKTAPPALVTELRAVARAASDLAKARDLEAGRNQFGAASEALVRIVAAHPSLQQGRTLFACPMVTGYGEWMQKSAKTSNPYFGASMLSCGTKKDWGSTTR